RHDPVFILVLKIIDYDAVHPLLLATDPDHDVAMTVRFILSSLPLIPVTMVR
ncbi:MAG: hypothetical protein GX472_00140, partial [Methanomicrobiales archaeon]|nr:hypothetical protein [Methanomicrobiales archaeon]